jgi:hypothetical protein
MYSTFDPNNITKEDMKLLAKHIESYVYELENTMIIPEEVISDKEAKQFKEAIEMTKKFIKKLKKGDQSVFKDIDDINSLF